MRKITVCIKRLIFANLINIEITKMEVGGTIYEAQGFKMKKYSQEFIDAFLMKPGSNDDLPVKDGMNDKEFTGVKSNMPHYRDALLVAFEIEPGVWSLNLAKDPDTIICQIDHNKKLLRITEVTTPDALTAQSYAISVFNKKYRKSYDTKRSVVTRRHDDDYSMSSDVIVKDFTNSKFITYLDISKLFKF